MRSGRYSAADVLNYVKKEILTIPNIISLFRIFIIPYILSLYLKAEYGTAAIWILISFASDVADGFIARHFDMISAVGKVLDPIADKLTQGTIFICLITRYRWLAWFTCFFAFKELTVLYLGFLSFMYTGYLDQAMWWGKVCTGTVIASLLLIVLFPSMPVPAVQALSGICIAMLVFALYMYAKRYHDIIASKTTRIPGDRSTDLLGTALAWAFTFAGGAALIAFRHQLAGAAVLSFVRDNIALLTAGIALLFLLKAAGFPVYMGLLYMVCGYVYGMPLAVCVCAAGGAIVSVIQYLRGKRRFTQHREELARRLTAIDAYGRLRDRSPVLFLALTRLMCLPTEVVSIYMGVTELSFAQFLAGNLLGKLPDMVLFGIIGSHITDIASPAFIAAAAVKILCSAALCLFIYLNGRRLRAASAPQEQA